MPVPTLAVANYFVRKAIERGGEELLTPMKLVKLVYIAHGWHLALFDEPLIGEAVEAWKYGPVVPTVYHDFKHYRDAQIRKEAVVAKGRKLVLPDIDDDHVAAFLDKVWDAYRRFTAGQLSTMTHEKNTPWYTVWNEKGGSDRQGAIIPNELIRQHYKQLAARRATLSESARD
jgi:uncharacterized phage-associated protein